VGWRRGTHRILGVFLGYLQEKLLQIGLRLRFGDYFCAAAFRLFFELGEQVRGNVLQNELRLVGDGCQVIDPAFLQELAVVQNADPIANLLHLSEEVRAR